MFDSRDPSAGGGVKPSSPPKGSSYGASNPSQPTPPTSYQQTHVQVLQPFTGSLSSTVSNPAPDVAPASVLDTFSDLRSGNDITIPSGPDPLTDRRSPFQVNNPENTDPAGKGVELRRQGREQFETKVREKDYKPKKTFEMTWDDYMALSDRGRAAVDFNTMLVQARERDLNQQESYDPSKKERKLYNHDVKQAFGKDGGSETYAPATMALLEKIDFKDKTEDLDNFLGLKAAITARDLKHIDDLPDLGLAEISTNPTAVFDSVAETSTTDQIVTGVQGMEQQLAEGSRVLQNFQATSKVELNPLIDQYGGLVFDPRRPPGFGELPPELLRPTADGGFPAGFTEEQYREAAFRQWFNALSLSETKGEALDAVLADIDANLPEQDRAKFTRYLDDRSRDTQLYGLEPGDGYRSPEEFRKLLGLDPLRMNTDDGAEPLKTDWKD